jgi:hypothetical protein
MRIENVGDAANDWRPIIFNVPSQHGRILMILQDFRCFFYSSSLTRSERNAATLGVTLKQGYGRVGGQPDVTCTISAHILNADYRKNSY